MSESRRSASAPGWSLSALLSCALVCAVSIALGPSCLERRDDVDQSGETRCATCHGDPARTGDYLLRSAPPRDLSGASGTEYPGVGAHAIHLYASATHGAIACAECHVVPAQTDSPGHADSAGPAKIAFGVLASSAGRMPSYDAVARTCSGSWCHREHAGAVWTEPRSSSAACGTCHDLPPALPHPQSSNCEVCHAQVIDEARHFLDPRLHVDGTVELSFGTCNACHGAPPPAPHPQLTNCVHCHARVVGPDNASIIDATRHLDGVADVAFDQSCTSCHGGLNSAPPVDLSGHTATTFAGVGAHQAHLATGARSRTVLCADCHIVPQSPLDAGHIDSAPPAEVLFSGVAAALGGTPSYANGTCAQTTCHGGKLTGDHKSGGTNSSPRWTKVDGTQAVCGSCHSLPPPAPHPYQNDCNSCHEDIGKDNLTFVHPELHVDGIVTFTVP